MEWNGLITGDEIFLTLLTKTPIDIFWNPIFDIPEMPLITVRKLLGQFEWSMACWKGLVNVHFRIFRKLHYGCTGTDGNQLKNTM